MCKYIKYNFELIVVISFERKYYNFQICFYLHQIKDLIGKQFLILIQLLSNGSVNAVRSSCTRRNIF